VTTSGISYQSSLKVKQVAEIREVFQLGGRFCLHDENSLDIQLMVIYFSPGSHYQRHRHLTSDEYYVLLSGKLTLTLYFDDLEVPLNRQEINLSANNPNDLQTFKMPKGTWHSVAADIRFGAVFVEAKGGPWHPDKTEFYS
jgi:cupin fold WbuC family metalloprotein